MTALPPEWAALLAPLHAPSPPPALLPALPSPLELLQLGFMRRALAEICLLALAGGLLGAWIVLRRLAFFSHAVGTATFPGLVVADASGISPLLAGAAVALGYAGGVERAARRGQAPGDAAVALLLVAALALGTVLASDVFHSGAAVDRLLFGTLLGIGQADLTASALAAVAALAGTLALGRAWTAVAFDPGGSSALGAPPRADLALHVLVALAVVAAIPAVGALLVTALLVTPAAAARLLTGSVPALLGWSVALAALEGVVGLYLADWLDAPPGPAIALLGAIVFAAASLAGART